MAPNTEPAGNVTFFQDSDFLRDAVLSAPSIQLRLALYPSKDKMGDSRIPAWFGLEGLVEPRSSQPSTLGRDTLHYPTLPQALSNLDISRDEAATTSLGTLSLALYTPVISSFGNPRT